MHCCCPSMGTKGGHHITTLQGRGCVIGRPPYRPRTMAPAAAARFRSVATCRRPSCSSCSERAVGFGLPARRAFACTSRIMFSCAALSRRSSAICCQQSLAVAMCSRRILSRAATPRSALRADRALPSTVRGPVVFSQGFQLQIARACRARRSGVQPLLTTFSNIPFRGFSATGDQLPPEPPPRPIDHRSRSRLKPHVENCCRSADRRTPAASHGRLDGAGRNQDAKGHGTLRGEVTPSATACTPAGAVLRRPEPCAGRLPLGNARRSVQLGITSSLVPLAVVLIWLFKLSRTVVGVDNRS